MLVYLTLTRNGRQRLTSSTIRQPRVLCFPTKCALKTTLLTLQVEKRMGPDGQMHPLIDFITFYGQQQGPFRHNQALQFWSCNAILPLFTAKLRRFFVTCIQDSCTGVKLTRQRPRPTPWCPIQTHRGICSDRYLMHACTQKTFSQHMCARTHFALRP